MNIDLLHDRIAKSNKQIKQIAKELGISRTAFYRKCNGITEFTLCEITKLIEILCIDSMDEVKAVFFADA